MGKNLVIKGADYSANAITSERVVSPSFTVGQGVRSTNGELIPNPNQKYCDVELATTDTAVIFRATGYTPYGLAFFNGNTFVIGVGYADYELHRIQIPQNANRFMYSYLSDARAAEVDKPVVNTITIEHR